VEALLGNALCAGIIDNIYIRFGPPISATSKAIAHPQRHKPTIANTGHQPLSLADNDTALTEAPQCSRYHAQAPDSTSSAPWYQCFVQGPSSCVPSYTELAAGNGPTARISVAKLPEDSPKPTREQRLCRGPSTCMRSHSSTTLSEKHDIVLKSPRRLNRSSRVAPFRASIRDRHFRRNIAASPQKRLICAHMAIRPYACLPSSIFTTSVTVRDRVCRQRCHDRTPRGHRLGTAGQAKRDVRIRGNSARDSSPSTRKTSASVTQHNQETLPCD